MKHTNKNIGQATYECLCISIKTKYSDTKISNVQNNNTLSLKNDKKLGIIYEDIELFHNLLLFKVTYI
jgi:hypothetical protein